ncbi:rhamnan synthesis F family protein [Teichococcus rhizosphaerae]|uniref:rhamnan synthesis F family protein n=1 Tax=Teichococcus rhizosphaerae TaxID=1335062 RepID=UPI00159BCD3A|nr:rhamnan synthesis F family protein [Pseudoroseomonas rhizosphaerae]
MSGTHQPQAAAPERRPDPSLALPLPFLPSSYGRRFSACAVIHLFHDELAYEVLSYVNNLPPGTDAFISTDTPLKQERIGQIFAHYRPGRAEIRLMPNRGRDIAPKIVGFRDVHERYEFVLHLHSKKSTHNRRLESWRTYLYETLSGSREQVQDMLGIFQDFPGIGMIFPQHYEYIRRWLTWDNNLPGAQALARRLGYALSPDHPLDFPSGSMFWARSAALRPLLDLDLRFDDFPAETGQEDATLAHAVERLYAIVCELSGHDWMKVARPELLARPGEVRQARTRQEMASHVRESVVRLTAGGPLGRIDDFHSTEVEPSPALLRILENNRKRLECADAFSAWIKSPILPRYPLS